MGSENRPGVLAVTLAGATLVLAALLGLDFLAIRPNRLAAGEGAAFHSVVPWWVVGVVSLFWAGSLVSGLRPRLIRLGAACSLAGILLLTALAGWSSSNLSAGQPLVRVSLGSGYWLAVFGFYLALTDGWSRLTAWRAPLIGVLVVVIAILALAGDLDGLSLFQEYSARKDRFWSEIFAHLAITGISVGLSALAGIPLGLLAFRRGRLREKIFFFLNFVQTIPSLALFGLLIAPLAFLANHSPMLRALGVQGIGLTPAVIALTLDALLPVVRHHFAGFGAGDGGMIEAGRGMGMSRSQVFRKLELPVALPIVLGGVRIACVQNIGNTAVAALIGGGGLGVFIFQGLGQAASDLILLGAAPTILLAVAADSALQWGIRSMTPRGLRP